jgi:hypothetical protein
MAHAPHPAGAGGPAPPPPCSFCGAAAAPSACSACKSAFYCAAPCQRAHWRAHKASCRANAAGWHLTDQANYGAWAARLSALLAVRPLYSTVLFHLDNLVFTDPDTPGALPEPMRGVTMLASPCLPHSVALEVLLLAAEARAAILTAPSAAARRSLKATAFTLTLLAASPASDDRAGEGVAAGSLPGEMLYGERLAAATGSGPVALSVGNAEAQFHIGLDYFSGAAPGCPGGRRQWKAACYWIFMSHSGGHAPALAWLRREGIISD